MAEAAWMASPVAGARILHERIGKRGRLAKHRSEPEPDEAEMSLPLSLLMAWTAAPSDDGPGTAGRGDD